MNLKFFFFALLVQLCSLTAFAYDAEIDGIYYDFSGTEATVTFFSPGTQNSSVYHGSVVIPSSVIYNGTTYRVTIIGDAAFQFCRDLTFVTIPNSVTRIGSTAFSDCSGLKSIAIPNSVTMIDGGAFSGCSGLISITIPNSVTMIGSGAFSGTAWYNTQPDGLVYAGKFAYAYKGTMPDNTTVNIKDGTLGIVENAFRGCSGLTAVTIPNSVISIGCSAFNRCSGLTSVNIPESATSIGMSAFEGCSGLTSVTIPNSVTSIGRYAFYGCSSLTLVRVDIEKPLAISSYTFSNRENAKLIVPSGCKAAYKAASYWKEFKEIEEYVILASGISLNTNAITLTAIGQTANLMATITPSNTKNKNVTWTSSNTAVATVSNSGVVTAKGNGAATITAKTSDGTNLTAQCAVTVLTATGISLNQTSLTMTSVGQTTTLTATVSPSNAVNKSVTWSSSNTAVATVSSTGVVTAKGNGTATITVKTTDGTDLSATCAVMVAVSVTSIQLDKTILGFSAIGQTAMLTATIAPDNAANKKVTWSSSNTTVAAVSSSGVVTAKGYGNATITAKIADGSDLSAKCEVTVMTPANATFNGSDSKISTVWYADRSMEPKSGFQEMHAVHYQPGNTDRSGDGTAVLNNKVFVFNLLSGFKGGTINATMSDPRDISTELTIVFDTHKYSKGIIQIGASGKTYTMTATNDVLSATLNGETMPVVKLLDAYKDKTGRWTEFQNNEFAKDLLNANPIFNADGTTTDAFYTEMTLADLKNIVPINLTGDIDFRVRYLRPIDIAHVHSGKAFLKDGAELGHDDLYMADIFIFTDWRQIYPFGYNITVSTRETWMDFYGIHDIYFNMSEIETDRDGKIEKLEDPNLDLTRDYPSDWTGTFNNRYNFRNSIGFTRYQNNGGAVGSYNIFIPYHIVHNWGEVVIRVQVPIVGTFDDEKNISWLMDDAIQSIHTSNDEVQKYYDLSGRKVTKPTKGIYIVNGKKVLVK